MRSEDGHATSDWETVIGTEDNEEKVKTLRCALFFVDDGQNSRKAQEAATPVAQAGKSQLRNATIPEAPAFSPSKRRIKSPRPLLDPRDSLLSASSIYTEIDLNDDANAKPGSQNDTQANIHGSTHQDKSEQNTEDTQKDPKHESWPSVTTEKPAAKQPVVATAGSSKFPQSPFESSSSDGDPFKYDRDIYPTFLHPAAERNVSEALHYVASSQNTTTFRHPFKQQPTGQHQLATPSFYDPDAVQST